MSRRLWRRVWCGRRRDLLPMALCFFGAEWYFYVEGGGEGVARQKAAMRFFHLTLDLVYLFVLWGIS